jgi:hypothetical protein
MSDVLGLWIYYTAFLHYHSFSKGTPNAAGGLLLIDRKILLITGLTLSGSPIIARSTIPYFRY